MNLLLGRGGRPALSGLERHRHHFQRLHLVALEGLGVHLTGEAVLRDLPALHSHAHRVAPDVPGQILRWSRMWPTSWIAAILTPPSQPPGLNPLAMLGAILAVNSLGDRFAYSVASLSSSCSIGCRRSYSRIPNSLPHIVEVDEHARGH